MTQVRRHIQNRLQVWNQLIELYGNRCVYCHDNYATQIDHVVPYSYCYAHDLENLRPSCARCNMLARDATFFDFEEKYNYVQDKVARHGSGNKMLLCSVCMIPYYSALHPNSLFCPACWAKEYRSEVPAQKQWRDWLKKLSLAEIEYRAYLDLSDYIYNTKSHNVPKLRKLELLAEYTAEYDK